MLAGPLAHPTTPGACYRRWRTVAFYSCSSLKARDQPQIRGSVNKIRRHRSRAGHPPLCLLAIDANARLVTASDTGAQLRTDPADVLAHPYHERGEVESASTSYATPCVAL